MSYKCPICLDYIASTSHALCVHIMNTADKPAEHLEWVESKDISYLDLIMKADYTPLMNVVEKECKID